LLRQHHEVHGYGHEFELRQHVQHGRGIVSPAIPAYVAEILLNNCLYDKSQTSIPIDNVDPALVHRPKRWHISFIRQFMMIIGPISSIYDFFTFGLLLWVFHASTNAPLFRTAWFVESLATQTLVVFVIRTAGNPLKSRPGRPLLIAVIAIVAIAIVAIAIVAIATVLPYTSLGSLLRFTPFPFSLLGAIACLAANYLVVVQVVKNWFYRKHALL
jgi:P-type Mg2+ transporter